MSQSDTPMQRGSRIFFDSKICETTSRLAISSGIVPVDNSCAAGQHYIPWAFVPKPPWHSPSRADLQILTDDAVSGQPWDIGADVAIVIIPEDYISPFASMLDDEGIRERCTPGEYTTISRHPQWDSNLGRLRAYVMGLSRGDVTDAIYFRIADPGLLTVTKDEFGADNRNFAGLHLDSWDRLPLRFRHRSRNRLCINFGREPRYSLFMNLPLMVMFRHMGLRDPEDIYRDYRGLYLGHRFMKARPDYPVVRLRIDPGEAYILPTDNLLHDASTEEKQFPDITLTFLGNFLPRVETSAGAGLREKGSSQAVFG
jgi:hypothetical protein